MQNYIIRDKYVQGKPIKKNKGKKNTKSRTEVGRGRGVGWKSTPRTSRRTGARGAVLHNPQFVINCISIQYMTITKELEN